MFKAKRLIEKGVPATSTRCSDHLSRQFLITASTFSHSSKNSLAEHINTLPTCLTLINTLIHIDKHTHSHSHQLIHSHTYTHTHAHRDIYKKREYVRLRNFWSCMERQRRWSGIVCYGDQGTCLRYLVRTFSTSVFALNILAFFIPRQWYFSASASSSIFTISVSLIWSKTVMYLIFNPCGEFQ